MRDLTDITLLLDRTGSMQVVRDETDLGADGDAAWAKYEKLKALALAPGTPAEGEVALRMAVQLARKLAGEES